MARGRKTGLRLSRKNLPNPPEEREKRAFGRSEQKKFAIFFLCSVFLVLPNLKNSIRVFEKQNNEMNSEDSFAPSARISNTTKRDGVSLSSSSSSSSSSSWINLHTIHSGDELFRRSLVVTRLNPSNHDSRSRNSTKTSGGSSSGTRCTIDILSIGSRTLPRLQKAQNTTWASHPSRRFFIAANELDDPDPNCSVNVTADYAYAMSRKCKKPRGREFWKQKNATNWLTDMWMNYFAREEWLKDKSNPGGWMCAQRRFTAALSKLLRLYREAAFAAAASGVDPSDIFPDYLILGDDDTAVNLTYISEKLCRQPKERERLEQDVEREPKRSNDGKQLLLEPQAPNVPTVYAGCMVRPSPVQLVKFSFPFGGFGTFFSRGALERFATPLDCNSNYSTEDSRHSGKWSMSSFIKGACHHLSPSTEVHAGEHTLFTPGMSVSDLMGAFTASDDHFCVHSDWAVGYFVNFYNISRHTPIGDGNWHHEFDAQTPHGRMFALDSSLLYKRIDNYCNNGGADACRKHPTSAVCHRLSPENMADIFNYSRSLDWLDTSTTVMTN